MNTRVAGEGLDFRVQKTKHWRHPSPTWTRIYGQYFVWNKRFTEEGIRKVDIILQYAKRVNQKILDGRWKALFKEAKEIGNFHGIVETKSPEVVPPSFGRLVFPIDSIRCYECKEGISWNWEGDLDKARIMMSAQEDLPLFIRDISQLSENAQTLLDKRLKGEKVSVLRQDLVDEHCHLETRLEHAQKIMFICKLVLREFVERNYGEMARENKYQKVLIKFSVNGRTYYYLHTPGSGFEAISNDGDPRIDVEI